MGQTSTRKHYTKEVWQCTDDETVDRWNNECDYNFGVHNNDDE